MWSAAHGGQRLLGRDNLGLRDGLQGKGADDLTCRVIERLDQIVIEGGHIGHRLPGIVDLRVQVGETQIALDAIVSHRRNHRTIFLKKIVQ